MSQKRGLSLYLESEGAKCEWRKSYEVKSDNRGAPSYETNHFSLITMRGIVRSYTSLSALCGSMNLPSTMNIQTILICYRKLLLFTKRSPIPQCTLPPMTFNSNKTMKILKLVILLMKIQ